MPAIQFTATVTTAAGCTWTASGNASWISVTAGAPGSGTAAFTFAVTANYDAPRSGTVKVRGPNAATGPDVQVAQAGCLYAIADPSPSPLNFAAAGGSGSFGVVTFPNPNTCGGATQDACIWTAQSNASWITVTSGMPRAGDNPVNFTVDRNTTGSPRAGTITVRDKVVQVTQAG
ncbi:MAG: BACON domain-containing protein [Bacteroidales bacterium]